MRALFRGSVVAAATTALVLGAFVAAAPTSGAEAETHTVTFTGPDIQQFVVPDGVTVLHVEAFGASGGNGGTCEEEGCGTGGAGGLGAHITADVPVTPGEVLTVIVGGRGTPGPVLPNVTCEGTLVDGGAGGTGAGDGGAGGCPAAPGGGGGGWAVIVRGDELTNGVLVAAAGGGGGGGGGNEDAVIGHPAGGAGGDSGSPGADGEGDDCHGFGGGAQALSDGGEGGTSFGASDGGEAANGSLLVGGGFGGDGGLDAPVAGAGGGGGGAGFEPGGGGGGGGANNQGCGGPGGGGAGGESHLDASADGSIVEGAHPGDATLTISYDVEIVELAPRLAG
jgi:hypothetical protein